MTGNCYSALDAESIGDNDLDSCPFGCAQGKLFAGMIKKEQMVGRMRSDNFKWVSPFRLRLQSR
jgi:hypothetical protein